ncbi:Uncharacterised protein [Mycobacteroides abscessus subsp. massiliense]|uniref:hypothetical protein n=1 Tax=Mycobacteriaceae TaxID=1762 RepID=UPI0007EF8B49|nr:MULTISPECIES: hypothetical protein [Mycobacteriaceae]MDO2981366.1 hypothetical protein [Mycobacteroides abscessus subsp. abscessus]OBK58237.1 hypothetical protein A5654_02620 [Mycolicibacterium fortuitum]SLG53747.1 Uncharacterised protein [Mycobacteroides abscessus subsp. massiliense]SLH95410.1 Uncharacterised protein [Mycobacteroides abscessus subsp. massiliense]
MTKSYAYDMRLKRNPTASNVLASRELAQAYAAEILERIVVAAKGLQQLSENPNATPADIIAAVGLWTQKQPGIKDGNLELLGAAVLGGATVTTAARQGAGIRPTTLSEHLTNSVARYRGQEMARDGDGWIALEKPTRNADQQVSDADPASFGAGHRHGTEAGADGSVSDTGEVRSGTSAPDRSTEAERAELDRLGIDLNKVVGDAIGEGGAP